MCAQALDSTITTIAPWRDAEFLERFKVSVFRRHGGEVRACVICSRDTTSVGWPWNLLLPGVEWALLSGLGRF